MKEGQDDALDMLGLSEMESHINTLDIIHLFGKEKLENIQKSLSKATGLAFVTVDFRGEPITETTLFTNFCQNIRNNRNIVERCKSSDAFGSIQAAVTKQPSVYFCPCGLLEVAIPIVVRGNYLGGFIGGQVRCNDAPSDTIMLENVMHSKDSLLAVGEYQHLMDEVPVYSYEKFLDIANLVFLVINQLSENEVSQHMQEDILQKRIKKMYDSNQRYIKEINKKDLKIMELLVQNNPYCILDTLTSLINMTVIEDAPKTNEMLTMFIEYIKYTYIDKNTYVLISHEMEQVERYLHIQQKKFGERLEYSIQIPKNMMIQKIPSDILMPFVQNALYFGIMLNQEGGKVSITGYLERGQIILEIIDNGPGMTQEELDIRFEAFRDKHEGYYIQLGISNAREKMRRLFGTDYEIAIEVHKGSGRKCILCWPERFDERIE